MAELIHLRSECTQLAILDLKKEDAEATARELVQAFEEQGSPKGSIQAIGLGVNIAEEKSVQEGMKAVMSQFGQVDVSAKSAKMRCTRRCAYQACCISVSSTLLDSARTLPPTTVSLSLQVQINLCLALNLVHSPIRPN